MSLITVHTQKTHHVDHTGRNYTKSETELEDRVVLQVDLLGNPYFKHNDTYYMISTDEYLPTGVELIKINNPKIFRENLINAQNLKQGTRSGLINANNTSLRGKAHESINVMTDEEKEDYMSKNDFMVNDDGCAEKKYFWVKYDDDSNDSEDFIDNYDDGFNLNGVVDECETGTIHGIISSDLLTPVPGSFDIIMIHGDLSSKRVVSNICKKHGFSTSVLTVYTSGKIKTNFVNVT